MNCNRSVIMFTLTFHKGFNNYCLSAFESFVNINCVKWKEKSWHTFERF